MKKALLEERYDELITMLAQKMVKVNLLKQGDQLREGTIRILHPETVDVSVNDSSLVTLVTFQKIRILLLADVGPKELDKILAANPQLKDVDVIQIPHHGKTITKEFMKIFRNKVFIASTGPNSWGEIDEAKMSGLQGDVYRTDRHGTIIIQSDGQQIQVKHE